MVIHEQINILSHCEFYCRFTYLGYTYIININELRTDFDKFIYDIGCSHETCNSSHFDHMFLRNCLREKYKSFMTTFKEEGPNKYCEDAMTHNSYY